MGRARIIVGDHQKLDPLYSLLRKSELDLSESRLGMLRTAEIGIGSPARTKDESESTEEELNRVADLTEARGTSVFSTKRAWLATRLRGLASSIGSATEINRPSESAGEAKTLDYEMVKLLGIAPEENKEEAEAASEN